jgi:hypothetical protein
MNVIHSQQLDNQSFCESLSTIPTQMEPDHAPLP